MLNFQFFNYKIRLIITESESQNLTTLMGSKKRVSSQFTFVQFSHSLLPRVTIFIDHPGGSTLNLVPEKARCLLYHRHNINKVRKINPFKSVWFIFFFCVMTIQEPKTLQTSIAAQNSLTLDVRCIYISSPQGPSGNVS